MSKVLAVSVLLSTGPECALHALGRTSGGAQHRILASWPLLIGLMLVGVTLLAELSSLFGLDLFPVAALFGVACGLSTGARFLNRAKFSAPWLGVTVAAALWAVAYAWDHAYSDPLLLERIVTGRLPTDFVFFADLASMVKTFHRICTGVDGIHSFPYHIGSYWLLASWSALLKLDAVRVHSLAFPVIFVPLFVQTLMSLASAAGRISNGDGAETSGGPKIWFLMLGLTVGLLPSSLAHLNSAGESLFTSPSYAGGLILSFLVMGILLEALWPRTALSKMESIAPALLVCGLAAMVGATKISLFPPVIAAVIYLSWRSRALRRSTIYWMFGITIVTGLVLIPYISAHVFARWELLACLDGIEPSWRPLFPLLTFYGFWMLLWSACLSGPARSWDDVRRLAGERKLLDVEWITLFTLVSVLPALVADMTHFTAYYFLNAPYWFAVACLLARSPRVFALARRSLRQIVTEHDLTAVGVWVLLVLPLAACVCVKTIQRIETEVDSELALRTHIQQISNLGSRYGWGYIEMGQPDADQSLIRGPQRILDRTQRYRLVQFLLGLNSISAAEKRRTRLYIPRTNDYFWSMSSDPDETPLIAPALSGFAMIDGLPMHHGCEFGYAVYPETQNSHTADTPDLCRRVLADGADQLWILKLNATSPPSTEKVDCRDVRGSAETVSALDKRAEFSHS
ncbi:MAG TPA: hypothetical protein VMU17_07570 [Elusimicrobiota bacterium]|nr:hypothetical protein [Elusimicrobiota bacterium]